MTPMDSLQSRLVPLSPLDQFWIEDAGITVGYVVKSVDAVELEAAAKRMIDKWRLLAGSVEWSKELKTWAIRFPVEGDVSHRISFTTKKLGIPLDTHLTSVGEDSVEILEAPPRKYFRHSSTPSSTRDYSKSNAPIVSMHVTEFTNCATVGISVPHGVFDASGVGKIIQIIDAELHGRAWVLPMSSETNVMRETLKELEDAPLMYTEEPLSILNVRREFGSFNYRRLGTTLATTGYEYFWKRSELKAMYLGENVVIEMVGKVKDEVQQSGKGWVSTGDILVAWFLKSAFSRENDANPVPVSICTSARAALMEKDLSFEDYIHNGLVICSMSPLSKQELATKSVSELAALHRETISAGKTLPYIQAYNNWALENGMTSIFLRRKGVDSCLVSNQISGRFDAIDFGDESRKIASFWVWTTPVIPDHFICLNKFKGGYLIQATLRRTRWDAVADELGKIRQARLGPPPSLLRRSPTLLMEHSRSSNSIRSFHSQTVAAAEQKRNFSLCRTSAYTSSPFLLQSSNFVWLQRLRLFLRR